MQAGRTARWLAGLATLAGLLAAAPGTAAADPVSPAAADIARAETTSATNGTSPKSVTVNCPAGTRVYSAAGRINGGVGSVVLDDVTPNDGLTSVLVTAYETAPDESWSLTGYATCGSTVQNLQRVFIASESNSDSPKSFLVTCPGSTRLYGLGAEITGGLGNVVLDDLTPNAGLTGVTVTAYENGAYAPNWRLTGYAICGNAATTMQLNTSSNPGGLVALDPVSPKGVTTPACPAGTKVHGAGGTITGGIGGVSLDDVTPNVGLGTVTATGYTIPGSAPNWRITAYAICAS
ncbi:MAG TPA: hypothetical protein VFV67_11885 [Actinophytocola sp.]|uniref:hypothetical protein n=1 Tax=Actinophytocola sp. TaxID=1872138 RepID=UPI002DB68533|nr:hypothetical protein [Actinophytocola sp.]HEU5471346.1 hypothetical protein [Actinophytocola sp.]